MPVRTTMKKETMNLKMRKGVYIEGFGGRKQNEK